MDGVNPYGPITIGLGEDSEALYLTFGFCSHCKANREYAGSVVVSGSGRGFIVGTCGVCGNHVTRIASSSEVLDATKFNDEALWDE
jgi:hypothetical protein